MSVKPIHIIIVIALVAVGAYLYLGGDLNLGNLMGGESTPEGTQNCNYGDRDIHAALCVLTGKALPWDQTEPYIQSLNMRMCSADGQTYITVGQYYKDLWLSEGYTLGPENYDYKPAYSTYSATFYTGVEGKAIIVGSGSGITSYYGHETMFITGRGALTTFYSFVAFINSV